MPLTEKLTLADVETELDAKFDCEMLDLVFRRVTVGVCEFESEVVEVNERVVLRELSSVSVDVVVSLALLDADVDLDAEFDDESNADIVMSVGDTALLSVGELDAERETLSLLDSVSLLNDDSENDCDAGNEIFESVFVALPELLSENVRECWSQ